MLRIYLCEDNQKQLSYFKKCISDVILIEDFDLHMELATTNPYQLLDSISNNFQDTGLYFLDIDLGSEINGLELGRKIRQKDPRGFIVFITTHSEMSYMTFVFVNRIFSQKTIENSVTFFFDMAPVHFRCHMFYFAISSKLVPFSFNVSLNR